MKYISVLNFQMGGMPEEKIEALAVGSTKRKS